MRWPSSSGAALPSAATARHAEPRFETNRPGDRSQRPGEIGSEERHGLRVVRRTCDRPVRAGGRRGPVARRKDHRHDGDRHQPPLGLHGLPRTDRDHRTPRRQGHRTRRAPRRPDPDHPYPRTHREATACHHRAARQHPCARTVAEADPRRRHPAVHRRHRHRARDQQHDLQQLRHRVGHRPADGPGHGRRGQSAGVQRLLYRAGVQDPLRPVQVRDGVVSSHRADRAGAARRHPQHRAAGICRRDRDAGQVRSGQRTEGHLGMLGTGRWSARPWPSWTPTDSK